jgi:two-component sensor histidine kinase
MGTRATNLKALLAAIVAPYEDTSTHVDRVILDGADVTIGEHAVTNLALLLHELTTNAVKYGALSSPCG